MSATTSGVKGDGVRRLRRIPGEPGIWVFAILDMLIFAEMFGIYGWYRADHYEAFHAAQSTVIPAFGLAYTVILLTSSWLVVLAISAARRGALDVADKLARGGLALGVAFAVLKLIEYGTKLGQGITPVTNDFFMFFFVMTFVHLLHASVGIGVLVYMRRRIRALSPGVSSDAKSMGVIETCGIYWHMVDLLWIVLFALFYLRG
ncbi:cytochrome c oxidase subunit 3 [Mycobacterium sp. URHB0044]|uniref:cytochrome c oxidase subunit 3 n=1 Tax=Mycobacterium sp. URHB0044 TaxID=1380386 RepID=UPI00048C787C|nr:cytochrome c oxidase subunit 3 [Mycobacterium sp. URHB0044]